MDRIVLDEKLESLARCAIHNYNKVDWAIVFDISQRYLGDFRDYALAMHRASSRPH